MENSEFYRLQLENRAPGLAGDPAHDKCTVFSHTRIDVISWAKEFAFYLVQPSLLH